MLFKICETMDFEIQTWYIIEGLFYQTAKQLGFFLQLSVA